MRDRSKGWAQGLDAAIEAAVMKSGANVRATISPVRRTSILSGLTAVDVRGFNHTVSSYGIAHVLKKHGNETFEKARGQKAITADDLAFIPQIMASADVIEAGESNPALGQPRLVFRKRVGDADYTYVGEVQRGKRRIEMVTMWKK